jgi:hypothetical protein
MIRIVTESVTFSQNLFHGFIIGGFQKLIDLCDKLNKIQSVLPFSY